MGLDGFVRCFCFEKNRANAPAAISALVKVDDDTGRPYLESEDRSHREIFSRWEASGPCPHRNFMLASRRLGNIAYITRVREILSEASRDAGAEFPILWKQVLYSGSHSGDAIPWRQAAALQAELRHLRSLVEGDAPSHILEFLDAMDGLVAASLQVGKPIGF